MFVPISIEEFADSTMKNNKGYNRKELIRTLEETLQAKKAGATCIICGAPSQEHICVLPVPRARQITARTMRLNSSLQGYCSVSRRFSQSKLHIASTWDLISGV